MNLLNARRVALDLREGRLGPADHLRYLLGSLVLSSLVGHAGLLSHRLTTGYLVYVTLKLALSLVGMVACFRANAAGDGRDFVPRLICLALPLAIWIGAGSLSAFYGSYYLLSSLHGTAAAHALFATTVPQIVLECVALGLYFALLCRFLRLAGSA